MFYVAKFMLVQYHSNIFCTLVCEYRIVVDSLIFIINYFGGFIVEQGKGLIQFSNGFPFIPKNISSCIRNYQLEGLEQVKDQTECFKMTFLSHTSRTHHTKNVFKIRIFNV